MRSHLEFRSRNLIDTKASEDIPQGESVAKLLGERLPEYGFQIERIHPEDWGWRVQVANHAFALWVGCGHYEEYADGHLCFIDALETLRSSLV